VAARTLPDGCKVLLANDSFAEITRARTIVTTG
jgi:hypothetical protein